jgi:hypothetical protein
LQIGNWKLKNERWQIANGKWQMANGQMANGQMADGQISDFRFQKGRKGLKGRKGTLRAGRFAGVLSFGESTRYADVIYHDGLRARLR